MNWTEISVAVAVISFIFGWLKADINRLTGQNIDLEKRLIALETRMQMMREKHEV